MYYFGILSHFPTDSFFSLEARYENWQNGVMCLVFIADSLKTTNLLEPLKSFCEFSANSGYLIFFLSVVEFQNYICLQLSDLYCVLFHSLFYISMLKWLFLNWFYSFYMLNLFRFSKLEPQCKFWQNLWNLTK